MAGTVANMTKGELKQLIESVVESTIEQKFLEILGDPDENLVVRQAIRRRLRRQQRAVAAGLRGQPLCDVAKRLGLE